MKTSPLLTLVVGLGAGLVGGVIGASLLNGDTDTHHADASFGEFVTEMTEMMGGMMKMTIDLESRLGDMELLPVDSERAALGEDGSAADSAVQFSGSSPEVMSILASSQFQNQVSHLLTDIRDSEERERVQRRDEAEAERLDERLVELTERLGLYGNQVRSMRTILTDERVARNEAVTKAREAGDWGSMRTAMREVREVSNAAITQVLSADQMTMYTEYQTSQSSGWRFGGSSGRSSRGGGGDSGGGDSGGH
jgi:uncharacterized membrane protein YgcG